MRRNLFWLNDEQWKRIKPHLPTDKGSTDSHRAMAQALQHYQTTPIVAVSATHTTSIQPANDAAGSGRAIECLYRAGTKNPSGQAEETITRTAIFHLTNFMI